MIQDIWATSIPWLYICLLHIYMFLHIALFFIESRLPAVPLGNTGWYALPTKKRLINWCVTETTSLHLDPQWPSWRFRLFCLNRCVCQKPQFKTTAVLSGEEHKESDVINLRRYRRPTPSQTVNSDTHPENHRHLLHSPFPHPSVWSWTLEPQRNICPAALSLDQ